MHIQIDMEYLIYFILILGTLIYNLVNCVRRAGEDSVADGVVSIVTNVVSVIAVVYIFIQFTKLK